MVQDGHSCMKGKLAYGLSNNDTADDLERPKSLQIIHNFTFLVFLHTSGLAEISVFNDHKKIDHIKY